MSIIEGTVDLTKEFARPVDAVFSAWSTEDAQRTWSDPGEGWEFRFERFRFAVGDTDVCRFGLVRGRQYINESRYLEIEAGRRIVFSTSLVGDARLIFAGTVAVTFEPAGEGTRVRLVEQGLYLDGQDDVAGHRSGWENSLASLARYVRGSAVAPTETCAR